MGTRANIVVKSGSEQVCLYQHFDGNKLPETLRKALTRGKDRWDDFQYLTRIIFSEMIRDDVDGLTGYGITQDVHDDADRVIIVNVDRRTVKITDKEPPMSFDDYITKRINWLGKTDSETLRIIDKLRGQLDRKNGFDLGWSGPITDSYMEGYRVSGIDTVSNV